jgi:hypothetical protein
MLDESFGWVHDLAELVVLKSVDPAAQEEHVVVEHGERLGLGHALLGLLVEGARLPQLRAPRSASCSGSEQASTTRC